MFKFFWNRIRKRDTGGAPACKPLWRRDPLGHRQLAAMSLRELADLPPDVLRDLCVTPPSPAMSARCKAPLPVPGRQS